VISSQPVAAKENDKSENMKQVLQNLGSGELMLAEVPCPEAGRGQVLIKTKKSLISAGTERMLLEFGNANWLERARQQPDKVKMVLEKVKTDGLLPTVEAVRSKLDEPIALGYCNVGEVIAVGDGVTGVEVGDRVASNGAHAEVVAVPVNLCQPVPPSVDDEAAAFTVLGSIALQGVRLAKPTLGERFVVTGLGLLGQLTVQLLRAHGCQVLGIDLDPRKLELARRFGAETVDLKAGEDPLAAAAAFTKGRGVDGVLITASTKSNEPVSQGARMCRKRGRIVLIGVVGPEISRADFYEKELTFQVSCSYGPGRYDPAYEQRGQDYPFGFVRWTEKRNFEAFLDCLAAGSIDVAPLISHRFEIEDAAKAYETLNSKSAYDGLMLNYGDGAFLKDGLPSRKVVLQSPAASSQPSPGGSSAMAVIGAGNYAGRKLIPAFVKTGALRKTIVSQRGVTASHFGKKFGFETASTDVAAAINDPSINTVVIATRHDSHASLVCQALRAGKHVFVEKPLALTEDELLEIETCYQAQIATGQQCHLMVGFNRRFAPHVVKVKELLAPVRTPKTMIMTVNAGAIPSDHWTQDRKIGGGRIIGEGCHFVDLMRHLVGAPIESIQARSVGGEHAGETPEDKASMTISFADGSIGTLHYFANGSKSFPKERIEIFAEGRILQIQNYRKLIGHGWPGFKKTSSFTRDQGQDACVRAFVEAVEKGGEAPIAFGELMEVGRAVIEADRLLRMRSSD
jgi:predicted dehydrogenase/threonine dehydrogenase-like Zn-dependent dehydrogenase